MSTALVRGSGPVHWINGDPSCVHGTALDVHCCNCHSGFFVEGQSCECPPFDDAPFDPVNGITRTELLQMVRHVAFVAQISGFSCVGSMLETIAQAMRRHQAWEVWERMHVDPSAIVRKDAVAELDHLAERLASIQRLLEALRRDVDTPFSRRILR